MNTVIATPTVKALTFKQVRPLDWTVTIYSADGRIYEIEYCMTISDAFEKVAALHLVKLDGYFETTVIRYKAGN